MTMKVVMVDLEVLHNSLLLAMLCILNAWYMGSVGHSVEIASLHLMYLSDEDERDILVCILMRIQLMNR